MSWQDDLRRLDDKLAAGQLTHEEHRKMRDELLASVSGGSAASPVVSPLRRPTVRPPQPVPHPAQSTPHAPRPSQAPQTQSWNSRPAPPAPEPPAETVVIPPAKATATSLLATERQTTAPSPADHRTTDSMPYPRRDTAAMPLTPAPPYAEPPELVAQTQEYRPAAPFPHPRRDRRKPTWLFLSVGVLLVLAVIITGTVWVSRNTDNAAAPPPTPSAAPSGTPAPVQSTGTPAPPPVSLESELPTLPGTPSINNSTMTLAKGAELNLYPQESVRTFTAAGSTEVACRVSTDGSDAYFVLAFPTKSPANAQAITGYLSSGAVSGGFHKTSDSRFTAVGDNAGRSMKGTWYVSGDVAVTLWVSQPSSGQQTALSDKFDRTLSALQLTLPER